jgi:DNA-binding CsgD family transcriptional regulator
MAMLMLEKRASIPIIAKRELEFLKLCCTENSYTEIAKEMNISSRTAEGYRDTLFKKLKVKSRTGLVLFALQTGIVPLSGIKAKT